MIEDINKGHILDTDHLFKLLMRLSIPSMVALIAMTIYTAVDTLYVSMYAGTDATAAITVVIPIFTMINAIATAYGVGVASTLTRSLGAKDEDDTHNILKTVLGGGMAIGVVLMILNSLFQDYWLELFGLNALNETARQYGKAYYGVLQYGIMATVISVLGVNLINAEGKAFHGAMMFIVGMVANIVLDPICIFDWGLGLGMEGAAYATIIGKVLSVLYFIGYVILSKQTSLKYILKSFGFNMKLQWQMFSIGLPTLISNMAEVIIAPLLMIVITALTTNEQEATIAIAIKGIGNQVIMLAIMLGVGVVQGMSPIISYNDASNRYDRVVKVIRYARRIIAVMTVTTVIIIFLHTEAVVKMFLKESQMVYLDQMISSVRIVLISTVFTIDNLILYTWYQALGKVKASISVVLQRTTFFIVPLVCTVPFIIDAIWGAGVMGLWICFPLSYAITFIICRRRIHKEIKSYIKEDGDVLEKTIVNL